MMATQMPQNQNQYHTFSAAAAVAPIVLWSEHSQGNVYLSAKNTFLEFYTDEKKAIKRHACARSASCDSTFVAAEGRNNGNKSPNTSATRSPSPSNLSLGSSGDVAHSPDRTPRDKKQASYPNSPCSKYGMNYDNCDLAGGCSAQGGYPMMMMPMMMPVMMPQGNGQQGKQQTQQELVKPQTKSDRGLPAKKQDLKEFNAEPVEEITTMMVRGIPCSFSQDTLMKIMDNAGLKGKYDFFYLPRAGNNGSNLGYAFINFTDGASASLCMATFNGVPLDPSRSMKTCTISQADIQGLTNLRKHFRRTAVSRGSRGPVFLKVFNDEENQQ